MILITTKLNIGGWERSDDRRGEIQSGAAWPHKGMNTYQTHINTARVPHFSLMMTCSVETGTKCPSDSKCIDISR